MKTPKGTRDLLPEEMSKLQYTIDTIRKVFEKFGFLPLETPAFEDFNLLSRKGSGEALRNEIYFFKDKAGRPLGLRFDLTVPLARVLANNPNLPKPFKRYQIGRVWRYDNPQKLRYREFWQADVDIVGTDSLRADAECLAVIVECLKELNLRDFKIRINNRKLLEEVLKDVPKNKILDAFRIIDKLDKIGIQGVKDELKKEGINPNILNNLKLSLNQIEKKFGETQGLKEMKELMKFSREFKIDKYLKFDLSLARGLEYYNGPVFEVMIGKTRLSCAGGGRYDNLIKTIGGPDLPATGISFGLDRLISLIRVKEKKKVFVIPVNNILMKKAFDICQDLRKNGIISDTDLMNRNLSKLLRYASKNYSDVIIVGERELKKKSVKTRNLKTGKEKTVKTKDLIKFYS